MKTILIWMITILTINSQAFATPQEFQTIENWIQHTEEVTKRLGPQKFPEVGPTREYSVSSADAEEYGITKVSFTGHGQDASTLNTLPTTTVRFFRKDKLKSDFQVFLANPEVPDLPDLSGVCGGGEVCEQSEYKGPLLFGRGSYLIETDFSKGGRKAIFTSSGNGMTITRSVIFRMNKLNIDSPEIETELWDRPEVILHLTDDSDIVEPQKCCVIQ